MLGQSAAAADAFLIEDPEVAMGHLRAFLQLGEPENHPAVHAFNRDSAPAGFEGRRQRIADLLHPQIKDT
jgi:hypothetical protein